MSLSICLEEMYFNYLVSKASLCLTLCGFNSKVLGHHNQGGGDGGRVATLPRGGGDRGGGGEAGEVGRQPQTPRLSASGTAPGGPGPGDSRLYEVQERRRATTPGAVITPGSNFDTSEVDRLV